MSRVFSHVVAFSFVLLQFCLQCAFAQDQAKEPATDEPKSSPLDFLKSLPGRILGDKDTPRIRAIKAGPFVKSPEAMGDARDIENIRLENLGLVDIPELVGVLNRIYEQLKELSGVQDVPGKVYVLADDSLDAKSTADGNVFVSVGWLRTVESDDEIVALLAHELGHVLLRHHDTSLWGKVQKQIQLFMATSSAVRERLNNMEKRDTSLPPQDVARLQRMQLLILLNDNVLHPAWQRGQETDADRIATDLLVKGGFSLERGLKAFLEHVSNYEENQEKIRDARKEQVKNLANEFVAQKKFDAALSVSLTNALSDLFGQLAMAHDKADARLADFLAYLEKHYVGYSGSDKGGEFMRARGRPGIKLILDSYRDTFLAISDVESENAGNSGNAVRTLDRVTSPRSPIASHVLPNFWKFQALKKVGKSKEAYAALLNAAKLREPSWRVYAELVILENSTGKRDAAAAMVNQAMERFERAPAVFPKAITLFHQIGMADAANKLNGECLLKHPEYRDACANSNRPRKP